jgi:hypothetical protein
MMPIPECLVRLLFLGLETCVNLHVHLIKYLSDILLEGLAQHTISCLKILLWQTAMFSSTHDSLRRKYNSLSFELHQTVVEMDFNPR